MRNRRSISKATRFAVLHRFSFKCAYCGISSKEAKIVIDHLMPISKSLDNSIDNLVCSCEDCNIGKSNLSVVNLPDMPDMKQFQIHILENTNRHGEWEREEAIAANMLRFIGAEPL